MEFLSAGELSTSLIVLLIVTAGLTSMMTAALGIGGGMLLLVVMASVLPIAALIPVHGLVQLGSNGNRALMTSKHIDGQMFKLFALGTLLGAIIASLVVVQLPLTFIQISIGAFLLYMLWGPKPKAKEMSPKGTFMAGAFTTFVSMFVGATGPLVATFVHRNNYSKMTLTATFAACMTFQHGLKAVVFLGIGFAFWAWLPLIIAMIASGALGTYIGLKVLKRIPSERFKSGFKIILSLLAARLLIEGVWHWLG